MNISKIRILFLLSKVKINKQGKVPIRCRITYLGRRKIFSTGFFINPDLWNSKKQKIDSEKKRVYNIEYAIKPDKE